MSVYNPLSCASSSMITLYRRNNGSISASRSNMPSVIYLIRVLGEVTSSNRIEYPTSSPRIHPISSATLAATVVAATRLGWVTAIIALGAVHPVSYKYCGNSRINIKLEQTNVLISRNLSVHRQRSRDSSLRGTIKTFLTC